LNSSEVRRGKGKLRRVEESNKKRMISRLLMVTKDKMSHTSLSINSTLKNSDTQSWKKVEL